MTVYVCDIIKLIFFFFWFLSFLLLTFCNEFERYIAQVPDYDQQVRSYRVIFWFVCLKSVTVFPLCECVFSHFLTCLKKKKKNPVMSEITFFSISYNMV